MAVEKSFRDRGIGRSLVAASEDLAAERGITAVVLHAQRRVEGFYAACGYVAEGETFFEEGIPHVLMRKRLPQNPRR
jgi:predicted GNAT family N-acyltransferase